MITGIIMCATVQATGVGEMEGERFRRRRGWVDK